MHEAHLARAQTCLTLLYHLDKLPKYINKQPSMDRFVAPLGKLLTASSLNILWYYNKHTANVVLGAQTTR